MTLMKNKEDNDMNLHDVWDDRCVTGNFELLVKVPNPGFVINVNYEELFCNNLVKFSF